MTMRMFRRRQGVLEARLGPGELVLLGPGTRTYLGLDEVGADIWDKLATPLTEAELVTALAEEYDAPPARIEADVAPFLADLLDDGVIEIAPDGEGGDAA